MSIYSTIKTQDCNIIVATSATVSAAIELENTLVGIHTPATITGTAITFTTNVVKGESIANYTPIVDEGGLPYTVVVAANRYIALDPIVFLGVQNVRIVSNDTEAADRSFKLVTRLV
jgi:hypothetical protein